MSSPKKSKKTSSSYLRYGGIAMQMFGLLFAAVWLGGKLDHHFQFEIRYLTVFLIIFVLIAFFVKLYYDLMRND